MNNGVKEDNFLKIYNNVEEDIFLKISKPLLNMFNMIDTSLHSNKRSKETGA